MARISEQVEWLNLIDRSGPFLVPAVLEEVFPQGLEKIETPRRQRLRAAYDEWRDAADEDDPELADLHDVWTRMVLQETLEYEDEVLVPRERLDERIVYRAPEHGVEIAPDFAVRGDTGDTRLLIAIHPPETDLEKPLHGDRWTASPAERMTLLCRASEVRIGLVTNGEEWMLVNAPIGSTSGYASWFARLWWLEPVTLKAFVSLLGVRRCFGPAEETLGQLLERSIAFQEEVTDTLGEQVRRAVEVLIQALGRADQDRNGELLKDVRPAELYEAGLTVMMRLVFILCAEERGLLLLGDPVYDQHYAISTLRAGLREDESQHGPEVLERRHDAWSRMLAVFRAVYGGVEHETLRMPALGGSLFDPDRFPFLEGRAKGTSWREEPAFPLPIDNRTVLLLLTALQVLEQRGGAQLLSYRALDVEQIGHVYEGLLEYTVAKLPEVTVGLIGSQKVPHPTIGLDELESLHAQGAKAAAKHLADVTGRSATAIKNSLKRGSDDGALIELVQACGGDENLARRLLPFAELIRTDSWGSRLVYQAGSFAITRGEDRHDTGTHYTPRWLTEVIAEKTLEPLVYVGPAEGKPREEWMLRTPAELLDLKICDPAMGSGAFLVQVCRYLAERLVEAWEREEDAGRVVTIDGFVRDDIDDEEPLPKSLDDRLLIAKRLVAERCLYGVDLNPLAVELAKLSIWLVTLAKGRPFGFLDHNLRCGDSLLGIHRLEQLTKLKMNPDDGPYQQRLFGRSIEAAVERAIELRKRLRRVPIRDIRDVEAMAHLDEESRKVLEGPLLIGDAFIGEALRSQGKARALETALNSLAIEADRVIGGDAGAIEKMRHTAEQSVCVHGDQEGTGYKYFHWLLEFPEVFVADNSGFDTVLGNPPWLSYTGRQKVPISPSTLAFLKVRFASIRRWPCSHSAFLLLGRDLLRNGGTCGFILPRQIADLDSFSPVRKSLSADSRIGKNILDIGEKAFRGVTQPVALYFFTRTGVPSKRSWVVDASSAHDRVMPRPTTDYSSNALRDLLSIYESLPKFPPKTFTDPGVHTGNVSKKIILSAPEGGLPQGHLEPVREGKDITAFHLGTPRKWVWIDPQLNEGEYCRIRKRNIYTRTVILLRQTANRPIAARHTEPTYFRNSILACHGLEPIPDRVLVGFLNSTLFAYLHRSRFADSGQKAFPQVKIKHLHLLPMLPIKVLLADDRRLMHQIDEVVEELERAAGSSDQLPLDVIDQLDALIMRAFDLSPDLVSVMKEVLA